VAKYTCFFQNLFLKSIFVVGCFTWWSQAVAQIPLSASIIVGNMEAAYASVRDYRATVEIKTFAADGSFSGEKFLYTFKKPNLIRLDFEAPHPGMIMIYPDENMKVAVKPSGFMKFLRLHLAVGNPLLRVSSGQSIDKTDMGLLIRNIFLSVTDERQGPVEIVEDKDDVVIRVLARNHFIKGKVTLYRFTIDKSLWLPARIEESTSDGVLERVVTFRSLSTNKNVPESIFQLDEMK
jgi:outer membrane lipoprotein-sorting protein